MPELAGVATPSRHWVGQQALAVAIQKMPTIAGLLLWLRHVERPGMKDWAATDGVNIYYGDTFADLPVMMQVTIILHEGLHCALQHSARTLLLEKRLGRKTNRKLANIAADAIINETLLGTLKWAKLPDTVIRYDTLIKHVRKVREERGDPVPDNDPCDRPVTAWSFESLYIFLEAALKTNLPACDGDDLIVMNAPTPDPNGMGGDGKAGADIDDETSVRRVMQEWSNRLHGLGAGRQSAGLLRALEKDLPVVRTPWELVARRVVARALAPVTRRTWMRPSRRGLDEPGKLRRKRVPRMILCIDVSGSINDQMQAQYAGEMRNIANRTGAELHVIVFDAVVTDVRKIPYGQDPLKHVRFKGGGGTDFSPPLARAADLAGDVVIVLTDLEATFPARRPPMPVIWAVPEERLEQTDVPFGTLLPIAHL